MAKKKLLLKTLAPYSDGKIGIFIKKVVQRSRSPNHMKPPNPDSFDTPVTLRAITIEDKRDMLFFLLLKNYLMYNKIISNIIYTTSIKRTI